MSEKIPPLLRGLPLGHFKLISADVPWEYVTRSKKGQGRSAERHYNTMSLKEIETLPVERYAADDAFLDFWITAPFLAIGAHIPIMKAWGFRPVAIKHTWLKPVASTYDQGFLFADDSMFKMGMGHTTRQNPEFVVLGRRGNPKRLSASIRNEIVEPAREHSRKPEGYYDRATEFSEGPRLELFGRIQREGWTVRGKQSNKFNKGKKK